MCAKASLLPCVVYDVLSINSIIGKFPKQMQTTNKYLQKMCNSGNFAEVHRVVESKTTKPRPGCKDMPLTTVDLDYLKQFTASNIAKILSSDAKIPDPLVKLAALLGKDHADSVKAMICNSVISRKSADISLFVQQSFQNPGSLKKIFDFLEQTTDSVAGLYGNMPADWNLDLKLVCRSLIMIKQVLCDYFFSSEVEPDSYSAGLVCTVNFERKLESFFVNKRCCASVVVSTDGKDVAGSKQNSADECVHRKMLSRVYVPYIDLFFEQCLLKSSDAGFQQNVVEKNIIRSYVEFFKQLECAYSIALYLDDREAYITLVSIVDRCLFALIRKTRIEEDSAKMIVVTSTILYVQHVLEEFINSVSLKYSIEFQLVSMEASRKLEKQQAAKIEREFNNNFSGNIPDFEASYGRLLSGRGLISDDVRYYILELCMSQLFSRIGLLKLNSRTSAQLADEVRSLVSALKAQFDSVPYSRVITDYLRIFTFPPEPNEKFIENFDSISGGRFEFTQILRAFEDQRLAMRLYESFKRMSK